jgi:hypothetical protein
MSSAVGFVFFTNDTILLKSLANLSAYNSPSNTKLGFVSNSNFEKTLKKYITIGKGYP